MANKTPVILGDHDIDTSFDPRYKTSMKSVLEADLKKGIEATGDFILANSADKNIKSFTLTLSVSISKDEKSKPPKVKLTIEYASLLTGKGSSGQQFKGTATSLTEMTSKIDEDVKAVLDDAVKKMTDKNGKMISAMRGALK